VKGETHKNGKPVYKQLLNAHLNYLRSYIDNLPGDYYLFSDGFIPGPKKITSRKISDQWKKLIIDGLGLNLKLYAAKHTGSSLFLSENANDENLKWLQMQMSHSSLEMTSIYTNKLKILKL